LRWLAVEVPLEPPLGDIAGLLPALTIVTDDEAGCICCIAELLAMFLCLATFPEDVSSCCLEPYGEVERDLGGLGGQ
jgi:hypothetical protein